MKPSWIVILGMCGAASFPGEAEAGGTPTSSDRFKVMALYQIACVRCHEAPRPETQSDQEWRVRLNTMGPRAHLDPHQKWQLLSYLQHIN